MKKGKRQLQAEKTKQRIFQTAMELFRKKGFDQVTVDEIVEKSNSSKGAFYGHFDSKYGIFLEKFKEIDNFYEEYVQIIADDDSLKEKILKLFQGQMHYLEHELGKDLMRSVYTNGLIESENHFFNNTERGLFKILMHYINKSIDNGELRKEVNPERIAMLITRCMRGNLYDWIAFGSNYNLQQESKQFIEIFMDGLLKQFGKEGKNNGMS